MAAVTFPDLPLSARYGLSAARVIALGDGPVSTTVLSAETGVPRPFLSKVLAQLVDAGLLDAVRGRTGGFTLAIPAEQITVLMVLNAVQEQPHQPRMCAMRNAQCSDDDPCAMHRLWAVASGPSRQLLHDVTIAELAKS